jgi:glucose/arabinose dehydrogenase
MRLRFLISGLLLVSAIAACSEPDSKRIETRSEAAVLLTDTSQNSPATAEPTLAKDQETREATPASTPTAGPTATRTPIPPSPTPTVPPAEHINVEQAPYAVSDCSDKYPCNEDFPAWEERLRVAPGFSGSVFARVDDFPTSLTFGPDGRLYVAGRMGTIYAIDEQGTVSDYFDGFLVPTGIAFQPGTEKLFVSNRAIDTNVDGEGRISVVEDGQLTHIIEGLPCCYIGMHGPNGIEFGPDGFAYVGVGGRADHGERLVEPRIAEQDELTPLEASILRFSPDGEIVEIYARGFRNPYDIAWDGSGRLYATDNGRDPDPATGESPGDELHLVHPGEEHGYPYYECSVCFGIPDGIEVIDPLRETIPHAAITGITAYIIEDYPAYYDDLFFVLWSAFEGAQKVVRFSPDTGEVSDFATGFAQPIDITTGPDGSLYTVDYATGIIFRIKPEFDSN